MSLMTGKKHTGKRPYDKDTLAVGGQTARKEKMHYFKCYKEKDATAAEITKEEARRTLEGYWKEESLNDVFDNEKSFRLFTPYAEVWTKDEEGRVPEAGFYGVVG